MSINLKNICVATDFSPESEPAVRYAAALAKQNAAALHLLHVIPSVESLTMYPSENNLTSAFFQEMRVNADVEIRRLLKGPEWEGLIIEYAIRCGVPYEQICQYADDFQIDMMIVGTHGRSGFRRFLLGSVAERVVRNCPCPVLTVRAKQLPLTEVPKEEIQIVVGPPETASEPHLRHLHFADHSAGSTGFVVPGGQSASGASLDYPHAK